MTIESSRRMAGRRLSTIALVALCLASSLAQAAGNLSSADLSYRLTFSDSLSHIDLGATTTWRSAGGQAGTVVGLETGTTSVAQLGGISTATTAFNSNGGSLSATVSEDLDPATSLQGYASAWLRGVIVLAPGASVRLDASYVVHDVWASGLPDYAFSSASVELIPPDWSQRRLDFQLGEAWSSGENPYTRSGTWMESLTNDGSTAMNIDFGFLTYALPGTGVPPPIPEPQTAALLLAGLVALGAYARRTPSRPAAASPATTA